jgi:hypothetical protein
VIPFRLDISGSGARLKGTFYNGFEPYEQTTRASFENGQLVLNIDHYLTTITATVQDGELKGKVVSQSRDSSAEYAFHATRHVDSANVIANVPSIAGSWEIPLETPSSKGEKAFRFLVEQKGPDVAASILRVDGDTGAYSGSYKDGKWVLSHFFRIPNALAPIRRRPAPREPKDMTTPRPMAVTRLDSSPIERKSRAPRDFPNQRTTRRTPRRAIPTNDSRSISRM